MNFSFKIFSILLATIITSLNIQSAGIFRLSTIDNQTNEQFQFGFADTRKHAGCYCTRKQAIKPNAIDETDMEIINDSQKEFEFSLISKDVERLMGNLFLKIVDKYIILYIEHFLQNPKSELISKKSINLDFDYLINFVIKSDYKIQMHVIQE